MKRRYNRKSMLGIVMLVILTTGFFYFSKPSTIIFYIENDSRMSACSLKIETGEIVIKEEILGDEFPYKILNPVKVKRGVSDVAISFDNGFSTSEKLFLYRKTHYVKLRVDFETKNIILVNTSHFIMYQ